MIPVSSFLKEVLSLYGNPRIPYVLGGASTKGIDCRGVVLFAIREAGNKNFRFSGTNEFRNLFATWQGTTQEAKRLGYWEPGLIVGNLDESTNKLTHFGVLIKRRKTIWPNIEGRADGDILNSSESKDGIILSDSETSGGWWNWCCRAEDLIEYGSSTQETQEPIAPQNPEDTPKEPNEGQAIIATEETGLRLRKEPNGDPICEMPKGSIVEVYSRGAEWTEVYFVDSFGTPHVGCCATRYLKFGGE